MNVLIVNKFLMGDPNAVGATMKSNLYGMKNGDEPVNFLQYCIDDRSGVHEKLVESIFMDSKDSVDGYFKSIKRKITGRNDNESSFNANEQRAENASNKKSDIPSTQVSKKGEILRGLYYTLPTKVSKSNMERIKSFKPDLIYTQGENIRVLKQSIKLSKKLKIPIVFHCMDDFKETFYTSSALAKPFSRILKSRIKKVNDLSVENLGICEKMAEHYSKTYNKPYSYASNCVTISENKEYVPNKDEPLKIIFSGAFHFKRGDSLIEVAKTVEQLNKDGYNINLFIFGPSTQVNAYNSDFAIYNHTELLPYVPQEKVIENLKSADILVHVEPFDEKNIKFVKYSFSTKLAEYLASGRCVIGYGPKTVAGIEYIERHNCGLIADTTDELRSIFIRLYENADERIAFAKSAYKTALNEHTKQKVQDRLLSVFKHTLGEK